MSEHGHAPGPLAGLRILDLTQALSGPFATMIFSDLGAEVVKIESPKGDLTRTTPPFFAGDTSVYFIMNNRSKKSVVLDLKSETGRADFYELVRDADVVINNFSPGVTERLGIEYARLKQLNPGLVYCSITGYGAMAGQEGKRAVDPVIQAAAGGMSITGFDDRPPARAGVPTADLGAGLYAAIGVLAALQRRAITGQGGEVETSLFHAQLSLLNYVATNATEAGAAPGPVGSGHAGTVPSQAFRTSDGWVAIDAGFDRHFVSFVNAIGLPELAADERYATRPLRSEHRATLLPPIEERLLTDTAQAWSEKLGALGIPCSPVNDVLRALELGADPKQPMVDSVEFDGHPVTVLNTPIWVDGRSSHGCLDSAPHLGADTDEVLGRTGEG